MTLDPWKAVVGSGKIIDEDDRKSLLCTVYEVHVQ